MTRDQLVAAVAAWLEQVAAGDLDAILDPTAMRDATALAGLVSPDRTDVEAGYLLGMLHWLRYQRLPEGEDRADLVAAVGWFAQVLPWRPDLVPRLLSATVAEHAPAAGATPGEWSAEAVLLLKSVAAGDPAILNRAVLLLTRAVSATAPTDPDHAGCLTNLGAALRVRFERLGDLADLDRAVDASGTAVDLTPAEHPDHAGRLSNLGVALRVRFERLGRRGDIDAAIDALRAAVERTAPDLPDRAIYLSNLSAALRARFERSGHPGDLSEAVTAARAAVHLTPPDDANYAANQSNVAGALYRRYERTGDLADLAGAIDALSSAVDRTASEHPNHAMFQSNLANALRARFDRVGELADLDRAIDALRSAIDATAPEHVHHTIYQSSLDGALQVRFERVGDLADLDAAIAFSRRAVELTPTDHPNYATFESNLGTALQTRFDRVGELADLDEAVHMGRRAVERTGPDHPDLAGRLTNLGLALRARFERVGALADLNEAVEVGRQAVDRTASDHPNRAGRLSNLGLALRARFEQTGEQADLSRAIDAARQAVDLSPTEHPSYARRLSNLAGALESRLARVGDPADLDEAATVLWKALRSATAAPSMRVRCGSRLGDLLSPHDRPGAMLAWDSVLELLPQVLDRTLSRSDRQHLLRDFAGVATSAAAAALAAGDPGRAWEVSEQGRGVLLAQTLQTAADPDLGRAHPELAAEADRLLRDLNADTALELSSSDSFAIGAVAARRRAAGQWACLMDTIRSKPGFARFGLAPTIADLRHAVGENEAVITVNVAPWRCDALILTQHGPDQLPLPDLTAAEAVDRAKAFLAATGSPDPDSQTMRDVLAWLWDVATGPVLDHLGHGRPPKTGPWPRVWWSPTGPLSVLPLHAAGHHDEAGPDAVAVLDRVVSSYTPTIRMLARARRTRAQDRDGRRVLVVGVDDVPGHPPLAFARQEALAVHTQLNAAEPALVDASATLANTRAALTNAVWAHFACHGIPADDPADSYLLLHDGALPVREIANLGRSDAWLAYLSACATAFGGTTLLDESIHIASAFQVAGFAHVVATLWPVNDRNAPRLSREFYTHLIDGVDPAQATHSAVHKLRARFRRHPHMWAPYVHFGP